MTKKAEERLDAEIPRLVSLLASELAEAAAKSYRIELEAARALILEVFRGERSLWERAAEIQDPRRLRRTEAYQRAAQRAKTEIYYQLRRYRQDDGAFAAGVAALRELGSAGAAAVDRRAVAARDAVVQSHVSTRERSADAGAFFRALFALVPEPRSVLDLGCGVAPLLFPFDGEGRAVERYLALDRDAKAVEAVAAWAPLVGGQRLSARVWSLSEGFGDVAGPGADGLFDLALALKLVPVLQRQEREKLAVLRDVPARRLLVTGAREAMVKRRSIERREERTLRAFADAQGFTLLDTLETPTEMGLLLAGPAHGEGERVAAPDGVG